MAINLPDFSKAPLLGSPMKDIFESVLKGYQMQQEPAKMKQEASARELANRFKQLEVEHKPKEYELNDKAKELANAMSEKANAHYEEKYGLERDLKKAQIQKALRAPGTEAKLNGMVANYKVTHPDATPEELRDFADKVLKTQLEHMQRGTERTQVLNDTQYSRGLSPVSKQYDELKSIQDGKFPGTDRPLSPQEQKNMQSSIMLNLVKQTTDPKMREKLINANNMNITLHSIDPKKLTYYSGIEGQFVDKPADAILEGLGEGSKQYKDYIHETNKATFAAKQMRQYLGDSIQPSAQEKLDKLTKPEAWNVSPQTAEENFNFMRDLYKQESQTLVRAVTDPSLYQSIGVANNPIKNSVFTQPNQSKQKAEPEIVGTQNGITTIRHGGKTLRIPEKLVDRYMIEHSGSGFNE